MKIAVLGAGFTGLTAGYSLAKKGHQVFVFEKEDRPGGLAQGFKLPGWQWSLEKFYHHFFASDNEAFDLIKELGLTDKLFFKKPVTAIYYETRKLGNKVLNYSITNPGVYPLDTPLNFLLFPHLSPIEKIRSGFALFYLKLTPFWQNLEKITAKDWIIKNMGEEAWKVLWQALFINKFSNLAYGVPASWFWARIKKRSRKLGYIKGGFQVLADKLVKEIENLGGEVNFNREVKKINFSNQSQVQKFSLQLQKCKSRGGDRPSKIYISRVGFEKIIVSLPTPVFLAISQELLQTDKEFSKKSLANYLKRLSSVSHLTALTLVLEMKKPFLKNTYWLNICDSSFPFLLLVEQTNFIEPVHYGGNYILYIGNYLPQDHPYLSKSKEELFWIFLPYLKKINPSFNLEPRTLNLERFVSKYAQPVFPLNYSKIKPKFSTPLPGLYLANQDQVYPFDRGVNYAIELGRKVAEEVASE